MKRTVVVFLALGLVFGAIATAEAKPKPVKTTLYMHGVYQFGEVDGIEWLVSGTPPMQMDTTEPTESQPRSMFTGNPVLNRSCTGLPTGFPTWEATGVSGTVVGDAKLVVHLASPPTKLTARLWIDTPMFSCNDAYIEPLSEVVVDIPAGQNEVEIVFPGLKKKATFNMIVEILGSGVGQASRVFYDSPDMATSLEFSCVPAKGAKSCV